jgi:hypothetical protein
MEFSFFSISHRAYFKIMMDQGMLDANMPIFYGYRTLEMQQNTISGGVMYQDSRISLSEGNLRVI